jgi:predicted ester cyclase
MGESPNAEALYRARERFNRRDAAYFDLYAGDVVLHGYPAGIEGRRGVERFERGLWDAFPDAELELDEVFELGDRLLVRYRIRGTHRGELAGGAGVGGPGVGNRVDVAGISIVRMEDGRVVERWQTLDDLGLIQQIGAIP